MQTPTVAVVMPVRNGFPYLPQAVDSILGQTFGDFEFLIVDDGSTDETTDYLRSFQDKRVRIIRNEQSCGVARSLNLAIAQTSAELIARQDADDISEPSRFARQLEYLAAHPECVAMGTQGIKINEAGEQIAPHFFPVSSEDVLEVLRWKTCPLIHGSVLMRRQVMQSIGGYRARVRTEDYDLWLRLSLLGKVVNHPETLYRYRVHATQLTTMYYSEFGPDSFLSRAMYFERLCTGEEDSLNDLSESQIEAVKNRRLWKPRGNWSRRVKVLRQYAKIMEKDSPRRAQILGVLAFTGGW
jgi:glycosyltransferase involved in cell wall biosynthesis